MDSVDEVILYLKNLIYRIQDKELKDQLADNLKNIGL